jgi:hypothetical protein
VTFLLLVVFMHVVVSSSAVVPLLPLDTKHVKTLKGAYILSLLPQTFFSKKIVFYVSHAITFCPMV